MLDGDYPILLFPKPAYADRAKRYGGGGELIRPEAHEQGERLTPEFQRLQDALDRRRITIQDSSQGIEPEMVLVLEVVGTIEEFFRAVEKVQGLEWLSEYALEDINPINGFQDSRGSNRRLSGRLFLMMSDQQALTELRKLFDLWKRAPEVKFRSGLAKLKEVFENLDKIRSWNVEDRLIDTGLLEDWEQRKQFGNIVPFEAELWYRDSPSRRQDSANQVRHLVEELNGQIVTECIIEDIAYHAMLGQIRISHVEELLNRPIIHSELALFHCDHVMFFRPVGQCAVLVKDETDEKSSAQSTIMAYPMKENRDPVVALLDGMPLTGHKLLDGYLVVDDPDGYEDTYQANERSHGTAMASLICRGDLNSGEPPLERPVYVRPIMKPYRGFGDAREIIPDDVLAVDLVHRAIIRMLREGADEKPAAPEIRIVNLSIGDSGRQFVREMSVWARLLDWLSYKYNLLFIVSAGNHIGPISLAKEAEGLRNMSSEECQKLVIPAVADDTRNRRLLSPAETLNGVTVGAVHMDESGSGPRHLIDPVAAGMPSVISAHGPGYRKSIKPDIHVSGGKLLFSKEPISPDATIVINPNFSAQETGQCVATPGSEGTLDATRYTQGTSNATALVTRQAYFFFELLESLRIQQKVEIPGEFDAVLIKALLIHGAEWGEPYDSYKEILGQNHDNRTFREYVTRFLGYGRPDFERVAAGSEKRVTVLGFGSLLDKQAAEFALPLPPSLADLGLKTRVIITLAWFSPINSRRQKYRVGHLWFDKPQGKIKCNHRACANHQAVQRGTLQHEIFEGTNTDTVQDGDKMIIKINCRKDADDILEPVRFGLTVTLEITEDVPLYPVSIYEEVRQRLSVRVPAGMGVQLRDE